MLIHLKIHSNADVHGPIVIDSEDEDFEQIDSLSPDQGIYSL